MIKANNEVIMDKYKKRKYLRVFIMILAVLTICLSILSLFKIVPVIFPLLGLVLETVLMRYRDKLDFKKELSSTKLPPH
ncbi:MAG: hypothetical protein RR047_00855 [Bacilli bacterium]